MVNKKNYNQTVNEALELIKNCDWNVGNIVYRVVDNKIQEDLIISIEFKVANILTDGFEYPRIYQKTQQNSLTIVLRDGVSFDLDDFNTKYSISKIGAVELEKKRFNEEMEKLLKQED